jgi:hypothetical protein
VIVDAGAEQGDVEVGEIESAQVIHQIGIRFLGRGIGDVVEVHLGRATDGVSERFTKAALASSYVLTRG